MAYDPDLAERVRVAVNTTIAVISGAPARPCPGVHLAVW